MKKAPDKDIKLRTTLVTMLLIFAIVFVVILIEAGSVWIKEWLNLGS